MRPVHGRLRPMEVAAMEGVALASVPDVNDRIIGDLPVSDPDAAVPLFKVAMAESAAERVGAVLRSGYIGQGPKVEEFEARLAERLGTSRIATLNSATSALQLAFHLLRQPTEM